MPLILTLSARRGGPPLESRTLSEGTLTIGRAAICEWVLADPDRLLSKTHCMIGVEGSRYVLTDLSTNGVFINGAREPTARDSRTFLTDGDSFALGSYTMMVTEVDVAAPSRATPSVGRAASPPADAFGTDGDDPFGAEPGTLFRHPIPPRPTKPLRLDDPFGPGPGGGLPAAGLGAADDDLFQGLAPDPSWLGPAQPDNADAARHAFAAPKAVAPVRLEDLDLDALLGEEPPTAPPRPPASGPIAAPPACRTWPRPVWTRRRRCTSPERCSAPWPRVCVRC
jgi:type VI secretion system protein ImpI/type VI secretion system protein